MNIKFVVLNFSLYSVSVFEIISVLVYIKLTDKSLPSDDAEMRSILAALDTQLCGGIPYMAEFVFRCHDVADAVEKLHPHKNDCNLGLSTDYCLHASRHLSVYIAFLHVYQYCHSR